jgi:hypothetical protein
MMLARPLIFVAAMLSASAAADDRLAAYISGGIGEDERASLEAARDYFNLRLAFAARGSGEYLAAVRVRIADEKGVELLETDCDGPLFYAKLAPGTYLVTAYYGDDAQTRKVRIGEKGAAEYVLYWVEPPDWR